jgi:hypothetical protein
MDSMKTTIDIPDQLLEDAMRYSGAKTKKEAVLKAVEEYNHRNKVEAFLQLRGSMPDFPSNDEIETVDLKDAVVNSKSWKLSDAVRSH